MAFSSVAMSARMSSVLMVSTSEVGSTLPATCTTSGSPKKRTTSQIGVGLADVREELVAQALALAGARHEACDVHELHGGGHDARRMVDVRQRVEARVGHGHHAHVGLDGGERDSWRARPPLFVRAVNSVDLPTFGRPTIPMESDMEASFSLKSAAAKLAAACVQSVRFIIPQAVRKRPRRAPYLASLSHTRTPCENTWRTLSGVDR